jgi:hypothetical protein
MLQSNLFPGLIGLVLDHHCMNSTPQWRGMNEGFTLNPEKDTKDNTCRTRQQCLGISKLSSYQFLERLKPRRVRRPFLIIFRMLLSILSFCSRFIQRRQRPIEFYRGVEHPSTTLHIRPEDFSLLNTLSIVMPPNRVTPPLPYTSHPLWKLRRIHLWTVLIGLFLQLFAVPNQRWEQYSLTWVPMLLAVSLVYVIYDLITWAHEKAGLAPYNQQSTSQDDNNEPSEPSEPKWPRKFLLVMDALLAFILQCIFWFAVAIIGGGYSYGAHDEILLQAYAALPAFFGSILHAVAFWKEFMAKKKAEWLRKLPPSQCARCGFIHVNPSPHEDTSYPGTQAATNETLPRWAQEFNSRSRGRRNDLETGLAGSFDGSEENLLITPETSDESTIKGYGTLSESVPSLIGEREEVIKKKKHKRVIGEDWMGKGSSSKSKGKAKSVDKGSSIEDVGA